MKSLNWIYLSMFIGTALLMASCDPETPEPPNEEEVITTLRYTLIPNGGGDTVVLSFQDLDGDGGNTPVLTSDTLAANTTYAGTLEILNETTTPADDITSEILEEDVDHQFFFETTVGDMTVAYNDQDENGAPVGLSTNLTTVSAGHGTLTITLRHEPNKSAMGVANGEIANAGGETDIEVTFDTHVQ